MSLAEEMLDDLIVTVYPTEDGLDATLVLAREAGTGFLARARNPDVWAALEEACAKMVHYKAYIPRKLTGYTNEGDD